MLFDRQTALMPHLMSCHRVICCQLLNHNYSVTDSSRSVAVGRRVLLNPNGARW